MLRDNNNETELQNFLLEIDMMKSLGKHPNIVSLLDYRTMGLYPFLVLEYCPRGDLLTFLRAVLLETPTSPEDEKEERSLSRTDTSDQNTTLEENAEELPTAREFLSVRSNFYIPGSPDYRTFEAVAVSIQNEATRKLQQSSVQSDASLLEKEAQESAHLHVFARGIGQAHLHGFG